MGLTKYKQKRNFEQTDEPEGEKKESKGTLIFCVQQHAASHLHYDFRLEMEGVLKSWAIPKGPSMNPEDKRLAMMVEDHPYDYKDFEGNIPAGNYGAGNVIVWDNGTYHSRNATGKSDSEKELLAGLNKGDLKFILHGKKLKGEFAIVKIKGGRQENAWLLIKKKDKYATTDDILQKNKSVISRKSLDDLEKIYPKKAGKVPVKKKAPVAANETAATPVASLPPGKIRPMMAELTSGPFDNDNWIFEIKHDGYRALSAIDGNGNVEMYSRNFTSFNKAYPSLVKELKKIEHEALIDGEVVVESKEGASSFQHLQNYGRSGAGELKYFVFDILSLDGNDTRALPLKERKVLAEMLLKKYKLKNIFYSEHVSGNGKEFYDLAMKNNLEGIIAKDANSPYRSGKRTHEWLKIKITQQQEAVIGGITEPKGTRNYFGSLLLGVYENNTFKYIGNCGTGFNEESLKDLYNKLKPYFINESPFDEKIKLPGKIQWIKPQLVCQVKFGEWTNDRHLRQPVYLGLRVDKNPQEVTFEFPHDEKVNEMIKESDTLKDKPVPKKSASSKSKVAEKKEVSAKKEKAEPRTKKQNKKAASLAQKPAEKMQAGNRELKVGKVTLLLTNQNKIYWTDEGYTKGDLVNYYSEVSSFILPYLKDRPQSMNRFPNGIKGPSFYQKDLKLDQVPAWIKSEKIFSDSNREHINYLICNDKATLLYMANLGCIEINPWNSRVPDIHNPDWLVIDLDPEDIAFKEVVKAAHVVRKVFDKMEIESYCKTSGATGLHIYIPLAAKYDYDIVKTFAQLIAQMAHTELPATTSIERSPSKRQKRVYLDFLQNRRGQTLAAPYSVRPKPGATVSTPLKWTEVNDKLDPRSFTIKTIFDRLNKAGDLWKPVIGKGVDIKKAMMKLNAD